MIKPDSKSHPDYWFSEHPYYRTGKDKTLHINYLCRARKREACDNVNSKWGLRNAAYSRLNMLRQYVMKTWDCTEIKRGKDKRRSPTSEFQLLDSKGKDVMSVIAAKHTNSWSAGTVTFDSYDFGQKVVVLQAVSTPQSYWRKIYWEELLPFIDDVKSIKVRLEGYSFPNTSSLNLADYAKELGLKITVGPDKFYLLDYNVLMQFDKNGYGITDSPKFPKRYSFGQMCHILSLIAGKPDISLDK